MENFERLIAATLAFGPIEMAKLLSERTKEVLPVISIPAKKVRIIDVVAVVAVAGSLIGIAYAVTYVKRNKLGSSGTPVEQESK